MDKWGVSLPLAKWISPRQRVQPSQTEYLKPDEITHTFTAQAQTYVMDEKKRQVNHYPFEIGQSANVQSILANKPSCLPHWQKAQWIIDLIPVICNNFTRKILKHPQPVMRHTKHIFYLVLQKHWVVVLKVLYIWSVVSLLICLSKMCINLKTVLVIVM